MKITSFIHSPSQAKEYHDTDLLRPTVRRLNGRMVRIESSEPWNGKTGRTFRIEMSMAHFAKMMADFGEILEDELKPAPQTDKAGE